MILTNMCLEILTVQRFLDRLSETVNRLGLTAFPNRA